MNVNSYSFLINHLNLLSISKRKSIVIRYNKRILSLIYLLSKVGYLNSFIILSKPKKLIKISLTFFKKKVFFKKIKLISTPTKCFSVKLSSLKLLNSSLSNTLLILETSKGLITHNEAIKKNISGKLFCILL